MVCCRPQHVKRSRMDGPAQSATNVGSCKQTSGGSRKDKTSDDDKMKGVVTRRPTSELLISCDQRCDDHTLTKMHLHPWLVLVVGLAGFPSESSNVDCIQRHV